MNNIHFESCKILIWCERLSIMCQQNFKGEVHVDKEEDFFAKFHHGVFFEFMDYLMLLI